MAIPQTIAPILPGQDEDYELQYSYLLEWCTKRLPKFPYYMLKTTIAQADDIHYEIIDDEKTWEAYVYVHGHMEPVGDEQNQTQKGQDWVDRFVLSISLPSLVDAGLATRDSGYRLDSLYIQNGDRFWYADHLYEVHNNKDFGMWGADGISPMWYELSCISVRPSITGSTGYDFNPSGS